MKLEVELTKLGDGVILHASVAIKVVLGTADVSHAMAAACEDNGLVECDFHMAA